MVCKAQESLRNNTSHGTIIQVLGFVDIIPTLITIIGNFICIVTLIKTRSLHVPSNTLVGALCVSDLFTGMVAQPAFLATSQLIRTETDIRVLLVVLETEIDTGVGLSFLLTFLVTMDRFIAICYPFKYVTVVTNHRYRLIIILTVCLVVLLTTLRNFYRKEIIIVIVTMQVALVAQVLVSYFLIYLEIRKQRKVHIMVGQFEGEPRIDESSRNKEETRKACTICIIIIVLIVCYVPMITILLYLEDHSWCDLTGKRLLVAAIACFILLINSAINPIVYALRMKAVRSAACRIFKID